MPVSQLQQFVFTNGQKKAICHVEVWDQISGFARAEFPPGPDVFAVQDSHRKQG